MMKRSYFTFGELLAVAAVCGVLLTLAYGAVGTVPDARVTVCADVMRGIDRLVTGFEETHGGTLMSANANNMLWGRQLRDGGFFKEFHDSGRNQPRGFDCPAETRVRKEGSKSFGHPAVNIADSYDYGLNWLTHAKITGNGKNMPRTAVKKPGKLIRMTEGTKFAIFHVPGSVTDRHGEDVANVLFEDGHITFMIVPYKDAENYDRSFWLN